MKEHIPYMILTGVPMFFIGMFAGISFAKRAFVKYLRRRYPRRFCDGR